ncbi:MAG: glycosyltransferase family 4 protein [Burkholderia gladioli]
MPFNYLKSLSRRAIRRPNAPAAGLPVSDEELLRTSEWFDANFYLARYPDVMDAELDPVDHYLVHGGREGRQPGPKFDAAFYTREYPDVHDAGINPLIHFLRYGQAEGRRAAPAASDAPIAPARRAEAPAADSPAQNQPKHDRRIIEASDLWDAEFYCSLYADIDPAHIDPLDHYVRHGGKEGRRPHPGFDSRWYLAEYPDVAASGMHPLVHFLTIGRKQGRIAGIDTSTLDTARRMIAEASQFESTIPLDPALAEPALMNISYGGHGWPGLRAWQALFDSLTHPYTHIVFMPWLIRGGADLAATHAVRAAIDVHGKDSTLVVLTDHERIDALDWLPEGTHLRVLSAFEPALTRADRVMMVEFLIRALQPRTVLNVNSGACWDAFVQKGGALRQVCDLYACLFCRDYTPDGRAAGYADTHFRDAVQHLTKVYFDNAGFATELAADYGLPPSLRARLVTLHQPLSQALEARHKGGPVTRDRVMWAGRFCAQKNVDLLIEIAARSPHLKFDVYGYGDDTYQQKLKQAEQRLSNLALKGAFSATTKLPINQYNAFLYTSLWDGLPLTLADLACMGIPIVASAVGGIPDLVRADTGWLVAEHRDAQAYIDALDAVCRDADEARRRAAQMVAWVKAEHAWPQFVQTLQASPSFLD